MTTNRRSPKETINARSVRKWHVACRRVCAALLGLLAVIPAGGDVGVTASDRDREAAVGSEAAPREILAIVVEPRGAVRARSAGASRANPSWPVQALDGLEPGTWIELAPGAEVAIRCQGGGLLWLTESGVVDARRCNEAAMPPMAALAGLRPDGGRLRAWNRSWALEGETRNHYDEIGLRPVLLSPRCPVDRSHDYGCARLLTPPDHIRWTAVAQADAYRLRWNGRAEVRVDAAVCAATPSQFTVAVCEIPWPDAWFLVPGATASLDIEARLGPFEGVRGETTRLERLETRAALVIQDELDQVATLGLNDTTAVLLTVPVLARANLLNEVVAALETVEATMPAPQVQVALGDGYRRLGLSYLARLRYASVLAAPEDAGDRELRAAAHLGQAWVHFRWDQRPEAKAHALAARSRFVQLIDAVADSRPRLRADLDETDSLLARIRQRDDQQSDEPGGGAAR